MKEESELKNQPDEIDLDKNSKNLRNLVDRPTPVVQAKSAEEIIKLLEEDARHYKQYGDHVEHRTVNECISKIKRFLPAAPSAKSVEVEEAAELTMSDAFFKLCHFSDIPIVQQYFQEMKGCYHNSDILIAIDKFANWQQQKQADTISRLREMLEELANINSTSPYHQELRVKAFGILKEYGTH
jgi:cell fate (sporulation/competence/biofilm development) regulator YmcA (YheA/YmcA/DUF963 family)